MRCIFIIGKADAMYAERPQIAAHVTLHICNTIVGLNVAQSK